MRPAGHCRINPWAVPPNQGRTSRSIQDSAGTGRLGRPRVAVGNLHFAHLTGSAPLDASSGKQQRHRLNRGGDRDANCALYQIALTRLATDEDTKLYMKRRIAEGKTKKEVFRCLKRYIAREVHRCRSTTPSSNPRLTQRSIRKVRRGLRIKALAGAIRALPSPNIPASEAAGGLTSPPGTLNPGQRRGTPSRWGGSTCMRSSISAPTTAQRFAGRCRELSREESVWLSHFIGLLVADEGRDATLPDVNRPPWATHPAGVKACRSLVG
jgi:hypothetical protein